MCRDDFKFKIQMLSTYRNLLMGLAAIGVFVMHFIVQGVLAFPSPLKKSKCSTTTRLAFDFVL